MQGTPAQLASAGSAPSGIQHGIHVRNCCGRSPSTDIEIRDNLIVARAREVIIGQRDYVTASTIQWIGNDYRRNGGYMTFKHDGQTRTWSAWRNLGHDTSGTYF